MTIRHIIQGDITHPNNRTNPIIGMNSDLRDVTGIGLPFVRDAVPTRALQLGSVISYGFGQGRTLHMIICHHLGVGGWADAPKHVRFGLDFLEHVSEPDEEFSIVQIGTGRVGMRDGADAPAIRTAMTNSYLDVDLFIYDPHEHQAAVVHKPTPLRPFRAWAPMEGVIPLPVAA